MRGKFRVRSRLRSKVGRYPMSERKSVRNYLKTGRGSGPSKYSNFKKYTKTSSKVDYNKKKKRKWYKPSRGVRSRIKKVAKNKFVQRSLLLGAGVGAAVVILPKEMLSRIADGVQDLGENVYNFAENLGDTAGSLVRAAGTGLDAFSNSVSWLSDNVGVVATIGLGLFAANRVM